MIAQIAEAIRDYGPDYGFTSEQTGDFATLEKNREAYNLVIIPMMAVQTQWG